LSNAEKVTKKVLSLPLYGDLGEDDIHKICDIIEYFHEFYCKSTQRSNLSNYDNTNFNNDWVQHPEDAMADHLCAYPLKKHYFRVK
jgi:hypothetical protein